MLVETRRIDALCKGRIDARAARQTGPKADRILDELAAEGIEIMDGPSRPSTWPAGLASVKFGRNSPCRCERDLFCLSLCRFFTSRRGFRCHQPRATRESYGLIPRFVGGFFFLPAFFLSDR